MEELKSKSVNLAGLLQFQKDAVISREILKKKTGTVTLFAFDKSQGLSEHTAPFDALVYCLEGEAEVTISGNSIIIKDKEMVIMPAGEPHSLTALRPFKMMLIMIRDLSS